MKKTDTVVELIRQEIENKKLLEIACGSADFSLSAARYAEEILCIDVDEKRLNEKVREIGKILFQKMDATEIKSGDCSFDIIVIYNGLYHIRNQYNKIISECKRVLKKEGHLFIIGTWKLDITLMTEWFDSKAENLKDNYIVDMKAEDL